MDVFLGLLTIILCFTIFWFWSGKKIKREEEALKEKWERENRDDERRRFLDREQSEAKNKEFSEFLAKLNRLIVGSREKIVSSYRATVSESSLGIKNYKRFRADLFEFLSLQITSEDLMTLSRQDRTFKGDYDSWLAKELIRVIESIFDDELNRDQSGPVDGHAYEKEVAAIVRSLGWAAQVTRATADQGVDVIATKGPRRIAIQCKYYAKPVGNRAVQEVVSGRIHYQAQRALIVAPNGFTASAMALGASNGVVMCHHSDLKRELPRLE